MCDSPHIFYRVKGLCCTATTACCTRECVISLIHVNWTLSATGIFVNMGCCSSTSVQDGVEPLKGVVNAAITLNAVKLKAGEVLRLAKKAAESIDSAQTEGVYEHHGSPTARSRRACSHIAFSCILSFTLKTQSRGYDDQTLMFGRSAKRKEYLDVRTIKRL